MKGYPKSIEILENSINSIYTEYFGHILIVWGIYFFKTWRIFYSFFTVFLASFFLNPFHPSISMLILHTVLYTFLMVLKRRISQTISSSWMENHFHCTLNLAIWFRGDTVLPFSNRLNVLPANIAPFFKSKETNEAEPSSAWLSCSPNRLPQGINRALGVKMPAV